MVTVWQILGTALVWPINHFNPWFVIKWKIWHARGWWRTCMCKGGSPMDRARPFPHPDQPTPATRQGHLPEVHPRSWFCSSRCLWEAAWCQMPADNTPPADDAPLPLQGHTDVVKHYNLTYKHLPLTPQRPLMLIPLLPLIHRQLTASSAQKCSYSHSCGSTGNHQILAACLSTLCSLGSPPLRFLY